MSDWARPPCLRWRWWLVGLVPVILLSRTLRGRA
jgi:hypothetical protein